jgi:hypothetical protein
MSIKPYLPCPMHRSLRSRANSVISGTAADACSPGTSPKPGFPFCFPAKSSIHRYASCRALGSSLSPFHQWDIRQGEPRDEDSATSRTMLCSQVSIVLSSNHWRNTTSSQPRSSIFQTPISEWFNSGSPAGNKIKIFGTGMARFGAPA